MSDTGVITEQLREAIYECWLLKDRLKQQEDDFIEGLLYSDMISIKQYNWLCSIYGRLFKRKLGE